MNLVEREYWARLWREQHGEPRGFLYTDDIAPLLPAAEALDFLEIGCAPGGILADFCLRFGYRAHGIDYSCDPALVTGFLESRGVQVGEIHAADFFSWSPGRRYDIVASFGFIEHFEDAAAVVDRHFELARPGGTVIIGLPNFARGQKVLHYLFDRANLRRHNTACMNLRFLRAIGERNAAEVRFARYVGGHFDFWPELPSNKMKAAVMWRVNNLVHRMVRVFPGRVNPWLSPYLIGVFRAPAARSRP